MNSYTDGKDIGRLEAKVDKLEVEMRLMTEKLDAISETLSQAKGGWRTLLLVGGAASAFGAFASKLMPWLVVAPR